jgi:arsenate reductase
LGFKIENNGDTKNPIYSIGYDDDQSKIICFSQKYNDLANPKKMFCAVITCAETDDNCPDVFDADLRVTTTYEDRTKSESTHAEINREIATECLYVFSKIKKL